MNKRKTKPETTTETKFKPKCNKIFTYLSLTVIPKRETNK